MLNSDNSLSAKAIRSLLPDNLKGIPIYIHNIIDSTNTECRRLYSCDLPFAVIAEEQSAGRGRQGKSFYSPAKSGLYLSLAVKSNEAVQLITLFAAVAVCRAIEEIYSLSPQIKWVNDLYLNGRKICGILCEATDNRIIIGIGVNCYTTDFPEDIKDTAGTLGNKEISRNALAAAVIKNLINNDSDFLSEYRERSLLTDKQISFIKNGQEYSATVFGISDNGNLLITYPNGSHDSLNSGEITLKKQISDNNIKIEMPQ